MRTFNAEVIRQFLADKSYDQFVGIDPILLVFPKHLGEIEDFIQSSNDENVLIRKDIFSFGSMRIVLSSVCF